MAEPDTSFYIYSQLDALETLLPILKTQLPFSNALYNRIRAPHNLPTQHCLFATTFPAPGGSDLELPNNYTILFSDRSRHSEAQIWIFNPLITQPTPLSAVDQATLANHLTAMIQFLKETKITKAPGWPFSPILKFACVHEYFTSALLNIAESKGAVPRATHWNLWDVRTCAISSNTLPSLPVGFTVGRVPEDQLDVVLATSAIPRQPSTMLMLPSVGLLNAEGKLVAWAYVGIDGALITLHVLPAYRRRGLATYVGMSLLQSLDKGGFVELGFDGSSGWVHSAVEAGNVGSERVMMSLGGKVGWVCSYIWIDSEKL